MSIFGAMTAGVSGLAAQSQALGMISDNISNVNTVGYKGVNARFSTLVTQAATVSTHTPGGVRSSPLNRIDQQGLLQASSSLTDLAIVGNGFFVVNEASDPGLGNDYLFTRAGSFRADADGNLVNTGGYYLQGWPLTNGTTLPTNTTVLSSLETVNVANLSGTARATTSLELNLNLPSTAATNDVHSVTVQIYDALGNAHDLAIDFTKTANPNQWDITVNDPLLASTGVVSGTTGGVAPQGSIAFDGSGTPSTITLGDITITGWTTGANDSTITPDLGTTGATDGLTQFAGNFAISFTDQDGLRFGAFTGVSVDEAGVVTALFDNGEQLGIYQLPLAMFPNPNGLEPRNGNAFAQTDRSGGLLLLAANTGGAGVVAPSALEASNVDLAEEFTNMIVTQRAYSASARIITTADEMLEELVRIR